MAVPALFTRMSSRPNSATVSATSFTHAAFLVTSPATNAQRAPSSRNEASAGPALSSLRPAITIDAPHDAIPCAIANPMPPLPPVTSATFPVKSNSFMHASGRQPGLQSSGPDLIRLSLLRRSALHFGTRLREMVELAAIRPQSQGLRTQFDNQVMQFRLRHQCDHVIPARPTFLLGKTQDLPTPSRQQTLRSWRELVR